MTKSGNSQTVRINYRQAAEILHYRQRHLFTRTLCDWSVERSGKTAYQVRACIKPLAFVPVAIVATAINIPLAIWDGGLRNLPRPTREVTRHVFFGSDRRRDGETYDEMLARLGIAFA